ncbi:Uncharacterised protein [uncultured Clostridium sp.]|uniref:hypothetical protein n=1 Tax=uncultured Clostridium sp. TaxID=59620 RepID=UPI000822075E|nr:hypothetical protein [uncultured Clostridium sp.]SCK03192.1 Uncharacterised protein [uncultured Clostridium sp.]
MELKKIVVGISEADIINFMKLQDKVIVNEIKINNNILVLGEFELLRTKIKFELEFIFTKVEHNNIYINISNFKIYKLKILNSIFKKAFNYIIKAFTEIEGVKFEGDYFKIELPKLINRYYREQDIIDINKLEVSDIIINDSEVEITFGGIDIDSKVVREELGETEVEYVEAEIVNNIEEVAITIEELQNMKRVITRSHFFIR